MEEKEKKKAVEKPQKTAEETGKYWRNALIGVGIFFAGVSVFATRGNVISCAVNLAILVFMVGFLLAGIGMRSDDLGVLQLCRLTDDFNRLKKKIQMLNQAYHGETLKQLRAENDFIFKCPLLKNALEEKDRENDTLLRREDEEVLFVSDIEDYVNDDLIQTAGNTQFNEFVTTAMTGLGILGTFIGLVLGLWFFDVSSTESMTKSIAPLIDGMKVAFLTSIFGVIFSVAYGGVYRKYIKEAQETMDQFLQVYRQATGSRPGNYAISELLRLQNSQNITINQLAEDISLHFGEIMQQQFAPVLTALPEQIAQSMQSCLNPTMVSMQETFTDLSNSLSEKITAAQNEGVGTLVEKFTTEMNSLVGNQAENLSQSVELICNWQKETVKYLEEAVAGVCKNTSDLEQINESLDATVEKLRNFVEEIGAAQERNNESAEKTVEKLSQAVGAVETVGNELAEITERSGEIMERVSEISTQITSQETALKEMADAQAQKLEDSAELIQSQMDSVETACQGVTQSFETASGDMVGAAEKLNQQWGEVLERSFSQFDRQLATALEHFSGSLTELQEIVEGGPKAVDSAVARVNKEAAQYMKSMQEYQEQFGRSVQSSISDLAEQMKRLQSSVNRPDGHRNS